MSPAEAQVLLSMCATVDNRKPDEDAAKAWAAMLDDLRFDDCRVAVIEHYKRSTDWLMPAKVRTDVRRIRAKRITDHAPLLPPPGLDDAEERHWLAGAIKRVGDGEVIDCTYGELVTGPSINFRELLPSPDDTTTDAGTCSGDNEGASDA